MCVRVNSTSADPNALSNKEGSCTNQGVVFDEEEEHHVLPDVLDGQMQGVVRVRLEHVVQEGGTQLSKVTRVELVLTKEERQ